MICCLFRLGDTNIVVDCATPKDAQAQESGSAVDQLQDQGYSEDHHHPAPPVSVKDCEPQQGTLFREAPSTETATEFPVVQTTQFENQQRLFQVLREQREYMVTNQDQGDVLNISQGPGTHQRCAS